MHYQSTGSTAAAMPARTEILAQLACGKHQSSPPCWLQQAALLRPVQSNSAALRSSPERSQCHGSPFYRQPQAASRALPSSLSSVRCSIKGSMASSSPCHRSSAAPAPWSRPEALFAGRSAARGSLRAGRPRRVPCRARRMSAEEACALLGIRGIMIYNSPCYRSSAAPATQPRPEALSAGHSAARGSLRAGRPRRGSCSARRMSTEEACALLGIQGSMIYSSPCHRSSAAPAPWSRPKALSAGHSAARGSLGAGRPRQVPCAARRMSTEEACALLGIRGSCSREELRASSPCHRPPAAPAPWSQAKALSAGHSAARGNLRAGRTRQVSCRARRMSTEEACALLGIQGSCSREELRAAYLTLMKEVGKHLLAASDKIIVRILSDTCIRPLCAYLSVRLPSS